MENNKSMKAKTKEEIEMIVNGHRHKLEVNVSESLADVLRKRLGLKGTKIGCREGECGACTVIMDGELVLSCMTLAVQCNNSEILTIEGLAEGEKLHPIQQSFIENHGLQCGFCTPSMILSAYKLLQENPNPSETEIRKAISGSICRCSAYDDIIESIKKAAEMM